MKLDIEGLKSRNVNSFPTIERSLRSLKSYGPRSYAILTKENGDFVQVAGGGVTCIVEMKTKNTEIRRAYLDKKKVPFEGYQIISCGAGEINAKPEEILFIDDAIKIFKNLFNDYKMSNEVKWK